MAHIHEKIDFTASIYIVFENKVLLHKHKKLGIWLPPGGHIELDEDPNEAAIREAKEETGLDIELIGEGKEYPGSEYQARDLILPRYLNRHFVDLSLTHEHVDCGFFARSKTDAARPEEDGGEIRWFTKEELEENEINLVPDIQNHALAALAELSS